MVGIKLASPATGTHPNIQLYRSQTGNNAYTSPGNKIVTAFNFKIEFNAPKRDMIYLYMYCFIYSKSKFVCKFNNNFTNFYTFDLFITFFNSYLFEICTYC